MNKDKWLSVIRHTLTFVGGILVVKGTIDESLVQQLTAGLMALIGTIWGIVEKEN